MDKAIFFAVILTAFLLNAALCMKDGGVNRAGLKKSASEKRRMDFEAAKTKYPNPPPRKKAVVQIEGSETLQPPPTPDRWESGKPEGLTPSSSMKSDGKDGSRYRKTPYPGSGTDESPERRDSGKSEGLSSSPSISSHTKDKKAYRKTPYPGKGPDASPARSEGMGTALTAKILSTARSSSNWVPWSPHGRSGKIPQPYASPNGLLLTHLHPFQWKTLDEIEINYGDIVVCHLLEKKMWKRTHWFLAMNGYELLHIYPRDDVHLGVVTQDDKSQIALKFPKFDSNSCKNLGNGGYNIFEMNARAVQWINRFSFYDEDTCGSYHWLVYWVTGKPPRPKRFLPGFTSSLHKKCRLNNIDTKPAPLKTDPIRINTSDDGLAYAEEFSKEEGWSDAESQQ